MDENNDIQSDSFFDDEFACNVCGKLCISKEDLDYHQKKHDASIKSNEFSLSRDVQAKSSCDSCSHNFESKPNLMQHKKAFHKEKVNVRWNFSAGKCELGDELSWFIQCENCEETVIKEIKCTTCEKVFDNINNCMQHNKSEHRDKVKMCKNKDRCPFQIASFSMTNVKNKMRLKLQKQLKK